MASKPVFSFRLLLVSRQQCGPSTVNEELLAGDAWRKTSEYSFDLKQIVAGLAVSRSKFHGRAGYGQTALRHKVQSGEAMWTMLILDMYSFLMVRRKC